MNTNNPFVIRTKEYGSLQRFFSGLKKFKAKIRLRRVAASASILAMDPLIYFAEANKGKAIGPKMTKAYIKFLASVKETQEVLQDFSVSGTFFGTLHDASLAFHTIH